MLVIQENKAYTANSIKAYFVKWDSKNKVHELDDK